MTNGSLAVTGRWAVFPPPPCPRRASRRSSAGSLIRGSFWMSWRYWSKAPEGLARKNAFALPPFDRAIARAPTVDELRRCWGAPIRSEEHTSELQSLAYLVCRLLLEKKKI